jgi:hypothetical protein
MTAPTDAQWSAMNKLVQSLYQRPDCGESKDAEQALLPNKTRAPTSDSFLKKPQ